MKNLASHALYAIVGGIFLFVLFGNFVFAGPPTLSPSDLTLEQEVTISIRARSFEPSAVNFHAGRKTKITFLNQDAELHAVVPIGLLTGHHLNIQGNGAPQFDDKGFKRVIIPSQGKVEIRFVPGLPGTYTYFCDMPGHTMGGTIIVE